MSETAKLAGAAGGVLRVSVETLRIFIARALEAVGMSASAAAQVGALIAEADAHGSDAHGVFRLPLYVKRIRDGGMSARAQVRVISERASTALLDGGNGMGHLVMKRAAEIAVEKARKTGVAWVGARYSNHAGPAHLYVRMPLEHDMIGLYFCVGNANHLPPWGGTEMLLSTNPIAIGIPAAKRPPIVLDMATTNAAYGKVKVKAQRGEPMPEGWMIDRQGKPLTDPKRSNEGFLLPIGGPKGYGLSLMFGLLAGVLNGAAFGRDVIDHNADSTSVTNTGHTIMAVDIAAFADVEAFKAKVDETWEMMKASPRLPGVEEVRLPGEMSNRTYEERMTLGVPIGEELRASLDKMADAIGVARL